MVFFPCYGPYWGSSLNRESEHEKVAAHPVEKIVHKPGSRGYFNVTEKQKDFVKDEKGKRKRYRERRPQLPYQHDLARECAVPGIVRVIPKEVFRSWPILPLQYLTTCSRSFI